MISTPLSFTVITLIISPSLWPSATAQWAGYPECAVPCLNSAAQNICGGLYNACLCSNPVAGEVAQCAGEDCGIADNGQTIDTIFNMMLDNCGTVTPLTMSLEDFQTDAGMGLATTGGPSSSGGGGSGGGGGYVGSSGSRSSKRGLSRGIIVAIVLLVTGVPGIIGLYYTHRRRKNAASKATARIPSGGGLLNATDDSVEKPAQRPKSSFSLGTALLKFGTTVGTAVLKAEVQQARTGGGGNANNGGGGGGYVNNGGGGYVDNSGSGAVNNSYWAPVQSAASDPIQ